MYIDKIPTGSIVKLTACVPGKDPMIFMTQSSVGHIDKTQRHMLYCTAVIQNGRPVDLSKCQLSATISNRQDGRNYDFAIDRFQNIKSSKNDNILAMLESSTNAEPMNFRRAPRITIEEPAVVAITGTISPFRTRLHDISTCGIAFLVPPTKVPDMNQSVEIKFEYPPLHTSYKVKARIVRTKPLDARVTLVGCDFVDYYPAVVTLCNHLLPKD